jgi:transcriptional regulator with XRE-family HTH domain
MPKRRTVPLPPLDLGNETLGGRLARLRKERGYTQVELAEKIGTIQALISDYETDRLHLSAEMAIRFALALEVSLDELLHPKATRPAPKKPSLKLLRRLKQIESLPAAQQTAVLRTIDAFVRAAEG